MKIKCILKLLMVITVFLFIFKVDYVYALGTFADKPNEFVDSGTCFYRNSDAAFFITFKRIMYKYKEFWQPGESSLGKLEMSKNKDFIFEIRYPAHDTDVYVEKFGNDTSGGKALTFAYYYEYSLNGQYRRGGETYGLKICQDEDEDNDLEPNEVKEEYGFLEYVVNIDKIQKGDNSGCPQVALIFKDGDKVEAFRNDSDAKDAINNKFIEWDYMDKDDKYYLVPNVTIEKYFGVECPRCVLGENVNINCIAGSAKTSLFGDPNYGGTKYTSGDYEGIYETPPSMAYMINKILNIMRIATIVIVMTLGTIDIVKAVIASQEDEMKKAQKAFVKRIIACVVVFLVPTLIGIVFNISFDMWKEKGFHSCTLEQINDTCAQYTTSSECFSHGCHYTNNKCVSE